MDKWTEDEYGMFAEAQGPYAPEVLNEDGGNDVFSRRFISQDRTVDVYAAPIRWDEEDGWTVTVCTQDRTAESYQWEDVAWITDYAEAVAEARSYIEEFDPETALD